MCQECVSISYVNRMKLLNINIQGITKKRVCVSMVDAKVCSVHFYIYRCYLVEFNCSLCWCIKQISVNKQPRNFNKCHLLRIIMCIPTGWAWVGMPHIYTVHMLVPMCEILCHVLHMCQQTLRRLLCVIYGGMCQSVVAWRAIVIIFLTQVCLRCLCLKLLSVVIRMTVECIFRNNTIQLISNSISVAIECCCAWSNLQLCLPLLNWLRINHNPLHKEL